MRLRLGEAAMHAQRAARPGFRHLWDAEVRVFSQWGEDGILDYLCDCLDIAKPRAVEFGAGNFTECNTRFMVDHRDAAVVCVDARADLVRSVTAMPDHWKHSVWPIQQWITPHTAPRILNSARAAMGHVDIVSLDLDGNDFWVAPQLDLTDVRIVVVEYNSLFASLAPLTVPRDDDFDRTRAHWSNLYYGASIRAWVDLLQHHGFILVGTNRVGSNAFFCREEDSAAIPLTLPRAAELHAFVDGRIRESRDLSGRLTLLSRHDQLALIAHLPVLNTEKGVVLPLSEAVNQVSP